MNPLFLATLLVLLVFVLLDQFARRRAVKQIETLYEQHRSDEMLERLDGWYERMFFPAYNRTYMRYNAFLQKGDDKAAEGELDALLAAKPSDEQRRDLLMRAFEFYLKEGSYQRAKSILDEMGQKTPEVAAECTKLYEVIANKSTAYIDEMEGQLETSDKATRSRLCYLLSLQYANAGDGKRAEEYRAQAKAPARQTAANES